MLHDPSGEVGPLTWRAAIAVKHSGPANRFFMTSPPVSSVRQEAGEEGWNAGECILSRCRIRSLDPDNTASGGKR